MDESLRLYFDQHIPSLVSRGLRHRGVDVLTAQEAGRCGLPDREQLQFAAAEGRVMVTFDSDYLQLAAAGAKHAGVAYCHPTKYDARQLLRLLVVFHGVVAPVEMSNHIEFL